MTAVTAGSSCSKYSTKRDVGIDVGLGIDVQYISFRSDANR